MIEATSEERLRWFTVFFSWPGGGGYRDVLAPSKRRAAWAVKFHPDAFGVKAPAGSVPRITRVVPVRRPAGKRELARGGALGSFERHFLRLEPCSGRPRG